MTPEEARQLLDAFECKHHTETLEKIHHAYIWTCVQIWLMQNFKAKNFPAPPEVPAITKEILQAHWQLCCDNADGKDTTELETRLEQLHDMLTEIAQNVLAENGLPESWTEEQSA